jgi:hypothetical protein
LENQRAERSTPESASLTVPPRGRASHLKPLAHPPWREDGNEMIVGAGLLLLEWLAPSLQQLPDPQQARRGSGIPGLRRLYRAAGMPPVASSLATSLAKPAGAEDGS